MQSVRTQASTGSADASECRSLYTPVFVTIHTCVCKTLQNICKYLYIKILANIKECVKIIMTYDQLCFVVSAFPCTVYTYTCTRTFMHTYMHMYTYVYTYILCKYKRASKSACLSLSVSVCLCLSLSVCLFKHLFIYLCTYSHARARTHTHTYSHTHRCIYTLC